jgi:nickel/cobalt transporter (NicO) family protein
MDLAAFLTLAATGLSVAFIHAAIPTHWLPFVVVARAQGWSRGRTLAIVTLCSGGHLLVMTAIGLALAWFGLQIDEHWVETFPYLAGGALIAIGLLILVRHWRGWTHGHGEWIEGHCQHDHGHEHHHEPAKPVARTSDWAAISGLFTMLTFSPCEGLLPVYLAGVQFGWGGVTLLSVLLAAGTWTAMLLFTWLTLLGVERVRFKWLEKCEAQVLGTLLILCGGAFILVEHFHAHG